MQKRFRFMIMAFCVFCMAMTLGCGGKKVISFSDVVVNTNAEVGPFGGKYIVIEVKGSATNNTSKPLGAEGMPIISWDGGEIKPDLSQEELKKKETCDVIWETHLDVKGTTVPELLFTGEVEFEGLDEAQIQLNEQLQKIAENYAAEEAAKQAEEKAVAEAETALNACEGKTAAEAYEVAKSLSFDATFFDRHGNIVTDLVTDESNTEVRAAKVESISADGKKKLVILYLDFEDPAAKEEREKEEQAKADFAKCTGKTVAEAMRLADAAGIDCVFQDTNGTDITAELSKDIYAKALERITIAKVESSWGVSILTLSAPLAVSPEDNEQFKAVFEHGESDSALLNEFVAAFDGVRIEFDGNISALSNHGSAKTRYDLLILGSDYGASYGGVSFQFRDVAPTSFKWRGTQPDSVHEGMNLHIVAEVDRYEESSGLLILKPVELSVR